MLKALDAGPRLLMDVQLRPVQGDRFQPTGFADLGAAVYERHDGRRMLLVESAQSVANRLEATCLKGGGPDIAPELDGLAYIAVKLTGATEATTSSLVEAHRLNSPFIISDKKFQEEFVKRAEYHKGQHIDWKKVARAVFHYDPNALLHGVFLANLGDGRIKLPRALTGFIEAEDVREAASGGVKNNALDPTGKVRAKDYDKDVYGNVPYARMEYTAGRITAYFNFDLSLLRAYGLPAVAEKLLVSLGLLKVRRFLGAGLRLRTACDLTPVGEVHVAQPAGFALPGEPELLAAVKGAIKACAAEELFARPPVTELVTATVLKGGAKGDAKDDADDDDK